MRRPSTLRLLNASVTLAHMDTWDQVLNRYNETNLASLTWLDAGQYRLTVTGLIDNSPWDFDNHAEVLASLSLVASAVPEPTQLSLWAIGGLLWVMAARRGSRQVPGHG
jgi:hypothetical protein